MNNKFKETIKKNIYPLIVLVIIILIWGVIAYKENSEYIMPGIIPTLKKTFTLFGTASFWLAFLGTLLRSIISYVISVILAYVLANLAAYFKPLNRILSPIVSILRSIPTMAIVLLLIIWIGPKSTPIVIALLVVMPSLYSVFYGSIKSINRDIIGMAKLDGANTWNILVKFYLPLSLPTTSHSIASSLSLNIKLVVAAEILSNTVNSIGAMMSMARNYFEISTLLALTIVTILISLILEKTLFYILKRQWKSWV